jgi:hypothetical protein
MNNYEAGNVVAIGNARDVILGQKPFMQNYMDQEGEINRYERVSDVDEIDE